VRNAETGLAVNFPTRTPAHRIAFGTRIWAVRTAHVRSTLLRRVAQKTLASGILDPASVKRLIVPNFPMKNRARKHDANSLKRTGAPMQIAKIGRACTVVGQTGVRGRTMLARIPPPPPPKNLSCSNLVQ